MRRIGASAEDAAVNFRVQRLHAAVHDFRKAGVVADLDDRDAGIAHGLCGAAGRQDLDAASGQKRRKIDKAGLVGNGNQGPPDCGCGIGHFLASEGRRLSRTPP
jgi:hypothetical protein